ncbi:MAG: TAXI family TRAP transporter solute-binding subunit [Desulfobacterales bacterium]|nr:TAXI family TRAP transporter solute-binding subunit [Desulfobacterales bacterium]
MCHNRTDVLKTSILIVFSFVFIANGLAADLGIITGDRNGTDYQAGLDLRNLLLQDHIDLKIYTSRGSVDNVYAVYKKPYTHIGIVQTDLLAFVARIETNATIDRMKDKLKLVFPLYDKEIHLLGRQYVNKAEDLIRYNVAIGAEGSGTYLTVKLLLAATGIRPGKMVPIGNQEALAELKAGNIDAMFLVDGYPIKLLQEKIIQEDELHLIPIVNPTIFQFYHRGTIPAGTYAWQQSAVHTATVKAALIAYDFKGSACESIGRFARTIYDNLGWLRANGHPKWHSVQFDLEIDGWQQYGCVQRHLHAKASQTHKPSIGFNPVLAEIKRLLK